MGTRNLTVVVRGGVHLVAQYGQYDGYPSGVGKGVLEFCRANLASEAGRAAFADKLWRHAKFVTQEEADALTSKKGWEKRHPQLSVRMADEVLGHLLTTKRKTVPLVDSYGFAQDSLFCEWAYVIDLDRLTLEMYAGFNKLALDPSERFALRVEGEDPLATNAVAAAGAPDNEYQPVRLVTLWPLDDLPLEDEFLAAPDYEPLPEYEP